MPSTKDKLLSGVKYPYKIANDLTGLLAKPESLTYYPDKRRKGKWRIIRDMLGWFIKNKEVNRYYYVYGLDQQEEDREHEVLGLKTFRHKRDHANQHLKNHNFNYVGLLRDKFVFGQFLTSLHFPTPRNIALLDRNGVTWLDTMKKEPLTSIIDEGITLDGFCKRLTGIKGVGSFPLKIEKGKLFTRGSNITLENLVENLDDIYLFQERIVQHPEMSHLHPSSVNTIRMVTFNNEHKVDVFCATQRIGAHGLSVDNWASGGIVVGIDLETGTLRDQGLFKPGKGGRVYKHPETGITFDGYKIPFFRESVELATNLHQYFYGIHSIGWDIAITEDGPMFIEGNDDWDGTIPMSIEKDFKNRFLRMFSRR